MDTRYLLRFLTLNTIYFFYNENLQFRIVNSPLNQFEIRDLLSLETILGNLHFSIN